MFAVVLAAGRGQRMRSTRPKVLHELAGRPLLDHVLTAVRDAGVERIIVIVGPPGGPVEDWIHETRELALRDGTLVLAHQAEPRGTGHALQCALPVLEELADSGERRARVDAGMPVLILNGDVPLVRSTSLKALAERTHGAAAGLGFATFRPADPSGYGRVVRDEAGRVQAIREHRNCTPAELRISECNVGLYCARLDVLLRESPRLAPQPPANEIYLTDLVQCAAAEGDVVTLEVDPVEATGVNTIEQLRELEGRLASRKGD